MEEDGDSGERDGPADDHNDRPMPVYPLGSRGAWLLGIAPGGLGRSPVISEPKRSTPLQSDQPELVIPSGPLWAMKYLRHRRFVLSPDDEFEQVRWASAVDDRDARIYVIDDGDDHCMVSRLVGTSPDGCSYYLVARVKRLDFDDVRTGRAESGDLFSRGKEITLCGVVEGAISNVFRAARFRRYRDVPADYLPPGGLIEFDAPL